MRITFEVISTQRIRSGVCPVCGKRGRQQRTFEMTVNPWNKNPDGTVRTWLEVHDAVYAQADEWAAQPFQHVRCDV